MSRPAIKIVTLNNFYRSVHDELARRLFVEMLRLKAEGYGPDYPEGFLPIDSTDYVVTHHLICREESGAFVPVAGLRQAHLSVCDHYSFTLPFLALVEEAAGWDQAKVLRGMINDHRVTGKTFISSGGFTIRRDLRSDVASSAYFCELIAALTCMDHVEHGGATMIGGGVVRFKTEKFWGRVGYAPIQTAGRVLPPVHVATANGEVVIAMSLEKPSDWAWNCYEKHRSTLSGREVIGTLQLPAKAENKKAA